MKTINMFNMTKVELEFISDSDMYLFFEINNLYIHAMFKFLRTGGFKWIDPKEFDSNKYSSNNVKGCVL